MRRQILLSVLVIVVCGSVLWAIRSWLTRVSPTSSTLARRELATPQAAPDVAPMQSPTPTVSPDMTSEQQRTLATYVHSAFEGLRQMGGNNPSPPSATLREAVESGEQPRILKAFHDAIYDRIAKMDLVIPALKEYLTHTDPFVRFHAAQGLYIVGERSAYDVALELVRRTEPFEAMGNDGRIQAAALLGKFREHRAANEILALFGRCSRGHEQFVGAFRALGVQPEETRSAPFIADASAMLQYARANRVDYAPKIREIFDATPRREVKNAAAWALATMTQEDRYALHLVGEAEPVLAQQMMSHGSAWDENPKTVKYLGSLKHPAAKSLLTKALRSPDPQVASYALVNLVFNQGGSPEATDFVIREMKGESAVLPRETLFQVAAKVSDPAVEAAGLEFDRRNPLEGAWRLYAIIRKDWPIYSWIDDFVVRLNDH